MKRKVIVLIVFVIVAVSVLLLIQNKRIINKQNTETQGVNAISVGEFCVIDYQERIGKFSENINVGPINSKNDAIKAAKTLWIEKYNYTFNDNELKIDYDSEAECWHIYRTFSPERFGGVPHAIIQKDGKIVAVWIDE